MSQLSTEAQGIITQLIREDFDKIDRSVDYIFNRSEKLIHAAKELGLNDLACEMANDVQTENI